MKIQTPNTSQVPLILKCDCTHAFQDSRYGKNMRVHNPCVKDRKLSGWRCTVCSHKVLNDK